MSEWKCEVCGVTSIEEPLYRNGPKGVPSKFRCLPCLDPEWIPDADLYERAEKLHARNKGVLP